MKQQLWSCSIITLFILGIYLPAEANIYYVSKNGADSLDGRSQLTAWKSLAQVNRFVFDNNDTLLFEGGAVFNGVINLPGTSGKSKPAFISSYGVGKATIKSGLLTAINIVNTGNMTISNLIISGDGYKITNGTTHGIEYISEGPLAGFISNIKIDEVEVSGFGGNGIYFHPKDSVFGFSDVRITNCSLHDNGIAGLYVNGTWDNVKQLIRFNNANIYVGNTVAFRNYGRSGKKDNWSGSGILVAGTIRGMIEHCEAYENGAENGSGGAGPIGIWTDDSKYITIQYCVSHHNKGGKAKKDGGGFDLDGGSFGCVIQYCNSYENEGAGYSLFQWQTGNPWKYDTIRYNNSTNDGRNSSYGSITCWGFGKNYKVNEAQVYGNKIKMDKPGNAMVFLDNHFSNVHIYDNEFCLENGATYSPGIASKVTVSGSKFKCKTDTIIALPDTTIILTDTIIVLPDTTVAAVVTHQTEVRVFPNPVTNGLLNISFSNMHPGNYTIRLVNIVGMVVSLKHIELNQPTMLVPLNVNRQAAGAYALQIFNEQYQLMKTVFIE
ncbi:MAG: T9SS type A sorting domain-containing protein [Bacteroidota bacterium]